MKNAWKGMFPFFLVALLASAAAAQEGALIKLSPQVLREVVAVDQNGTRVTRLEPASSASPGEVLTFRIDYVNEGAEEAREVILTNPVPEHMLYVEGSAGRQGAAVTFSVDGGVSYRAPDSLTVAEADGRPRRAEPSDYTHIRWRILQPVPPGGGGSVRFRAAVK